MIQLPSREVIIQFSPIKTSPTSRRALAAAFALLAAAHGAPAQEQIRTAPGSPPEPTRNPSSPPGGRGREDGIRLDRVEFVAQPATVAAAIGLAEGSFTTGGGSPWSVAPYDEIAGHGARAEVTGGGGDSWLELPVKGPAEISFPWKAGSYPTKFSLLVDGKELDSTFGSMDSGTVRVEVPAGSHTLRWVVRAPEPGSHVRSDGTLGPVSIAPLSPAERSVAALGIAGPVAFHGDWSKSALLRRGGRASWQAPPEEDFPRSRAAAVKARFTGPGEIGFWYYAEAPGPGDTTSRWDLAALQSGLPAVRWEGDGITQGWLRGTLWIPPGEHLCEWSVNGVREPSYRAALQGIGFTSSKTAALEKTPVGLAVPWTNDATRPWSCLLIGKGRPAEILSPDLVDGESSRLAAVVHGPGTVSFRWQRRGHDAVNGTFLVNGETIHSTDWHAESDRVEVVIPTGSPVALEWIATAEPGENFPQSHVALADFKWSPWPVRPLKAALDTPRKVAWTTSPDLPFTGRDDAGAKGGSSAYAALRPGEESWLEATVKGPGSFDFWLRGAAGSDLLPDPWEFWSLTIDGQPVEVSGTSWEPFWIPGAGTHRIRLTFRCPDDASREWIAGAVDQVSWLPMTPMGLAKAAGSAGLKWQSHGSPLPAGYSAGGRHGGATILLNPHAGEATWVEAEVQGPCELSWDSALEDGWSPGRYPRNSLQVDGQPAIPLHAHGWKRMRLTLPDGTHRVRWLCDPWLDPPSDDRREVFNAAWRISGLKIRRGLSPLAKATDAPGLFALETGDAGGTAVKVAGEIAWSPGRMTSLYFFDPLHTGKLTAVWGRPGAASWGWRHRDEDGYADDLGSDGAAWEERSAGLRPGSFSRWSYEPGDWWDPTVPPPVLASLALDTHPIAPLDEAIESPLPVTTEGWSGFTGPTARTGGDAAWSFVNRHGDGSHRSAEITVHGPAKLSFWWKREGTGSLSVSVDGGQIPVPAATGTWQTVELAIHPGEHKVRWRHESGPDTSAAAPGEAWLDGCELRDAAAVTLDQAASLDPALILATAGDDWHPVAHAEADGSWTEAVRAVSGSRVLRATVTGPAVLSFRGRCFGGLPTPSATLRNSIVIDLGGGSEVTGHFLTAEVNGTTAARIAASESGGWQDGFVHVPEGTHDVTFRLMTAHLEWFGEVERDAVQEELQGWLDDLRLMPLSEHFAAWASSHHLPDGKRLPAADADGDGVSNEVEYWLGTAPGDPGSTPPALELHAGSGARQEPDRWLMIPYVRYPTVGTLEHSSDLSDWEPLDVAMLDEPPASSWLWPRPRPTSTHHPLVIEQDSPRQYFRLSFPALTD